MLLAAHNCPTDDHGKQNRNHVIIVDKQGRGAFSSLCAAWEAGMLVEQASIVLRPGRYCLKDMLIAKEAARLRLCGDVPPGHFGEGVTIVGSSMHTFMVLATAEVEFVRVRIETSFPNSLTSCVSLQSEATGWFDDCQFCSQLGIGISCQGHATLNSCSINGSSSGIVAHGGACVKANSVAIRHCVKAGAELRGTGTSMEMKDSVIEACSESGVVVHGNAKILTMTGTTFSKCGAPALCLKAGHASLAKCAFKSNTLAIGVRGASLNLSESTIIADASESLFVGVEFRAGGCEILQDNTISVSLAVHLSGPHGSVKLDGNTILGKLVYRSQESLQHLEINDGTESAHMPNMFSYEVQQQFSEASPKAGRSAGLWGHRRWQWKI
jgi:hypothetical protein